MRMLGILAGVAVLWMAGAGGDLGGHGTPPPLAARARLTWAAACQPGQTLRYVMTGSNQGWTYQTLATEVARRDVTGALYAETGWSDFRSNAPMSLSPESLAFRQTLCLDGSGRHMAVPDLSHIQPFLIGPITDTLTLYSDLMLARRLALTHVGQHAAFPHGTPNSWADSKRVVLGQDAVDFDLALLGVDPRTHTATLQVRHVPPARPAVDLPARWMQVPVADTPNNWVEVEHTGDKYTAEVGQETFDVRLVVDSRNGRLISARLANPVRAVRCVCDDAALSACGPEVPETLRRDVTFDPAPPPPPVPRGLPSHLRGDCRDLDFRRVFRGE